MRGEHEIGKLCRDAAVRFIPACAGNTTSFASGRWSSAVHPRMRGEHSKDEHTRQDGHTVHPRMRGEHATISSKRFACSRFIPACAGNTSGPASWRHNNTGSSPHARGTLEKQCNFQTRMSVHPRMRGEHSSLILLLRK